MMAKALFSTPIDRNPANHDGKGSLWGRNLWTGTREIMMAKGLFSAGNLAPVGRNPGNHDGNDKGFL